MEGESPPQHTTEEGATPSHGGARQWADQFTGAPLGDAKAVIPKLRARNPLGHQSLHLFSTGTESTAPDVREGGEGLLILTLREEYFTWQCRKAVQRKKEQNGPTRELAV